MDTKILGKRGVDMDMITKKSVKRGVDMDTVTEFFGKRGVDKDMDTAWNRCPPNSAWKPSQLRRFWQFLLGGSFLAISFKGATHKCPQFSLPLKFHD